MHTITASVDVDVDARTAYDGWARFEAFPEFMEGVDRVVRTDDTHLHWVTSIGSVTREFDVTVTRQEPGRCVAWRSQDGTTGEGCAHAGPTHAGTVTFHRTMGTATRVVVQMHLDPEGFTENVPDRTGILERRVRADLERFKRVTEARGGDDQVARERVAEQQGAVQLA